MMDKKEVLKSKRECTGCGACKNVCPVGCIDLVEDKEGFCYPQVDEKKCIDCGKCSGVCFYSVDKIKSNIPCKTYVVYSYDENIRSKSSSGGFFSELARITVLNGGHVYGAVWGENFEEVHHTYITTEDNIKYLRGSKYLQSNTGNTYQYVFNDLEKGINVLFSGTPCQVAGLYKYLKKDYEKLITCAVICHGVPSPLVWRKHLRYMEGRRDCKLKDFSFRDKSREGWINFNIKYNFEDNVDEYYRQNEDIFFRSFLENLVLRPSCYECDGGWKSELADIVLGDFWGIENTIPYVNYYEGVNAVLINSLKGEIICRQAFDNCFYKEVAYEDIYKYNPCLRMSAGKNKRREPFFSELELTGDVETSITDNLKWLPTKEKRQTALYPIMHRYLEKTISGNTVLGKLKGLNIKNVVLYANTELMKLLLKDITNDSGINVFLSDKNFELLSREMNGYSCIYPSDIIEMINDKKLDIIIVCSLFHENEIINQFLNEGMDVSKIVSAVEIIYNL